MPAQLTPGSWGGAARRVAEHAALLVLATIAASVLPSAAAAQPTMTLSQITGPGGTRESGIDLLVASSLDCDDPAATEFQFLISNVPSGRNTAYVWLGASDATCEMQTSRTGDTAVCDQIGPRTLGTDGASRSLTLSLAELQLGTLVEDPCATTAVEGVAFRVFAFLTASEPSADVDTSEFTQLNVTVDVTGPSAVVLEEDLADGPAGIPELTGDTSITLDWSANGAESLETYRVSYQQVLAAEPDCTPSASPILQLASETGPDATSTNINPSADLGLGVGQTALVFVTGIDRIGNVGTASNAICVRRVETQDFCELYQAETGEACPESCAAGSLPRSVGWLAVGLAWLCWRRRRAVPRGVRRPRGPGRSHPRAALLGLIFAAAWPWIGVEGAAAQRPQAVDDEAPPALRGDASSDDSDDGSASTDSEATAQDDDEIDLRTGFAGRDYTSDSFEGRRRDSRELMAWELLRVGLQTPDGLGAAFDTLYGSDSGPLIATEINLLPLRIPFLGRLGGGIGFGWAEYGGQTRDSAGNETDEETKLRLMPLSVLAVLRADVLARRFGVPFVLTGKVGLDATFYRVRTGATTTTENLSLSFRWAAQLAFELDVFSPQGARALDEEWGINHTFVFFELYGNAGGSNLPVGTDLGWTAGLGLSL